MSRVSDVSLGEHAAALSKSDLITLVTEGRDDYSIFRNLQDAVGFGQCLSVGGRRNVLGLHERKRLCRQ